MAYIRPMRPVSRGHSITRGFGVRGSYQAGYHTGIDYGCPSGTTVRSPRGGTVIQAGYDSSYGYHVMVRSWFDGKAYFMAHLSSISVREGQKVVRGQRLGRSGNTGNSSGPHLHAEQRHRPYGYWDHERPGW